MAKLPGYKQIRYTDFPQQFQQLVEQLCYIINNAFASIFGILNNGISIRDNIQCSVKDINVTVDASGKPLATASFQVGNSNPIDGTLVIRALNASNNQLVPTSGLFITYTQNANKVTITNITGLPANTTFNVRVIAFLT